MPETVAEPARERASRLTSAEKRRIVRLRTENKLPGNEIAQLIGRANSSVYEYLHKVSPENQALQEFIGKEADTLSYKKLKTTRLQLAAIEALEIQGDQAFAGMDPDKIARFYKDFEIANSCSTEKERLIRGLSTSNVAYADMSSKEAEIEDELVQLRESMGQAQHVVDADYVKCSETDKPL